MLFQKPTQRGSVSQSYPPLYKNVKCFSAICHIAKNVPQKLEHPTKKAAVLLSNRENGCIILPYGYFLPFRLVLVTALVGVLVTALVGWVATALVGVLVTALVGWVATALVGVSVTALVG